MATNTGRHRWSSIYAAAATAPRVEWTRESPRVSACPNSHIRSFPRVCRSLALIIEAPADCAAAMRNSRPAGAGIRMRAYYTPAARELALSCRARWTRAVDGGFEMLADPRQQLPTRSAAAAPLTSRPCWRASRSRSSAPGARSEVHGSADGPERWIARSLIPFAALWRIADCGPCCCRTNTRHRCHGACAIRKAKSLLYTIYVTVAPWIPFDSRAHNQPVGPISAICV